MIKLNDSKKIIKFNCDNIFEYFFKSVTKVNYFIKLKLFLIKLTTHNF